MQYQMNYIVRTSNRNRMCTSPWWYPAAWLNIGNWDFPDSSHVFKLPERCSEHLSSYDDSPNKFTCSKRTEIDMLSGKRILIIESIKLPYNFWQQFVIG